MNIAGVVSFSGAWETLTRKHQKELDELVEGLTNYANGNVELVTQTERKPYREYFEKALYDLGWSLNDKTVFTDTGRRVPVRYIGPVKNGVAAQISFSHPDFLTRWLFTHSTLAVRHGLASIPILLVPMREGLMERENAMGSRMGSFEYYSDQLQMLSPLSIDHPFLILGYSNSKSLLSHKTDIKKA